MSRTNAAQFRTLQKGQSMKGSVHETFMFSAGCARQKPLPPLFVTSLGLCSLTGAVRDGVFFDVETDFGFGRQRWGREERPELLEYLAQRNVLN